MGVLLDRDRNVEEVGFAFWIQNYGLNYVEVDLKTGEVSYISKHSIPSRNELDKRAREIDFTPVKDGRFSAQYEEEEEAGLEERKTIEFDHLEYLVKVLIDQEVNDYHMMVTEYGEERDEYGAADAVGRARLFQIQPGEKNLFRFQAM